MEQRRLRLGDILDDYCPRERRVTNHAVVAMIEENVKQTRCTTCEAEHVYKGGKAPRRKKSDSTGALYKEVLAGITDQETVPASAVNTMSSTDDPPGDEFDSTEEPAERDDPEPVAAAEAAADEPDEIEPDDVPPVDEGPVHRPLIRAQLARPEGVKVERQAPDFTIRQNPSGRGGSFRGGGGDSRTRGGGGRGTTGGGASNNNGSRFGRGPQQRGGGRTGGTNQGFGRGPGSGGSGPQRSGGPRKRSR
jgi:hypothetical protein